MSFENHVAVFMEPLDVLVLRGNRLFADAGTHGDALMPPWPSVAAGSLRSRMLVDAGVNVQLFSRSGIIRDAVLSGVLGTPSAPGTFRIRHFGLARRHGTSIEPLYPLPADLMVVGEQLVRVDPRRLPAGVGSSYPLPALPVLATNRAAKQDRSLWLGAEAYRLWEEGQSIPLRLSAASSDLWSLDGRLGIGTRTRTGTVIEGALYTTEGIAMRPGVGFVAAVAGAEGLLPSQGLLRFGGDGRGANLQEAAFQPPQPDAVTLREERRFRLLLTTPAIFPDGWRLPGVDAGGRWHFDGGSARLVAASHERLQSVSGWDLAQRAPKPAVRAVPAGAVYWFDDLQGDPPSLLAQVAAGLPIRDAARRAEGFNNCLLARWPQHSQHPQRVD